MAPRLVDGARRAAGLVAADRVVTVPVLDADGDKADVGGDCAVDIAPIAALAR